MMLKLSVINTFRIKLFQNYSKIFTRQVITSLCNSKWFRVYSSSECTDELDDDRPKITPLKEAKRFIFDCLVAVGCNKKHANIAAENLITADFRGYYSQGMNILESLIEDITSKAINPNALPTPEIINGSSVIVNGMNGLGSVNGIFSMDLAIEKAKRTGVGMVCCYHSNHYGISSMYTLHAIKRGLIGISASNTSPFVVPTRAKDAAIGTNPISFGAPGLDGNDFVLDIATSAASFEKIEIYKRENEPIPEGWALNEKGTAETDPGKAIKSGRLLPLGGHETNSGYKGYGLGIMVDILCGCLSGSDYGPNIRHAGDRKGPLNIGHIFIALNPKAFTKDPQIKINSLLNTLREMEPAKADEPVLVPGDLERLHMQQVEKDGGLRYVHSQHDTNGKLAKKLNVAPMQST